MTPASAPRDRRPLERYVLWVLSALSAALTLRYLAWRLLHTLDLSGDAALLAGAALLGAECFGFVSSLLFLLQVLPSSPDRRARLEGEPPSVDVLVTVCTEPAALLRRTLVACRALDYPQSKRVIWVLDDGNRAELRELAASLGCRYLARSERVHAKAGNLNNALRHATGEFLLLLDTDHVPVRSFLRETLGYFADPDAAFVQTPHHFYNPDCYQRNLLLEDRLLHEQDLFFHLIQRGRAAANAVIFAGSAAVFRRAALDDIGGFRTDCATEDMHTGMELQARDWVGVYHPEPLSAGLSPEDFPSLLVQRKRWTKGAIQLFFLDNPLLKSGLSPAQRLMYLGSLLYFFQCWMRLVFLAAPLAFLLGGLAIVAAPTRELALYFLPHYLASYALFHALTREQRTPFWSEVYETAGAFALSWTALLTLFTPERLVFHVTPKGAARPLPRGGRPAVAPHLALLFLLSSGLLKAAADLAAGRLPADAFLQCGVWAALNVLLLAAAVSAARERATRRGALRLRRDFPVLLSGGGVTLEGRLIDLSEEGARVRLPLPREPLPRQTLRILGDGETVELEAELRSAQISRHGELRAGLSFRALTEEQRRALIRLMFSAPDSWRRAPRPRRAPLRALQDITAAALRAGSAA